MFPAIFITTAICLLFLLLAFFSPLFFSLPGFFSSLFPFMFRGFLDHPTVGKYLTHSLSPSLLSLSSPSPNNADEANFFGLHPNKKKVEEAVAAKPEE